VTRRLLWARLADQRPNRELAWLAHMPGTRVTEVGSPRTHEDIDWRPGRFRRPVRRFVEAGALAWQRDLATTPPAGYDWIASLELCALVTGQAHRYARRHGLRQAVLTWENRADQPLYRIPPYRGATRRALRADLFVCFLEAAREHLRVLGVEDDRIAVVAPPVDLTRFTPAPEPAGRPVLVYASPVAPNKGIDRVLDAFDRVRAELPEAELRVLGSGPLVPLVRAAEERTRGAVRHLGHGGPDLVARELRAAAVFVSAPRPTWKWNEQYGLAYVEAMASGLPVVTTRCGTNHEAVPAPNPLVADDPEALAAALLDVLGDTARRHALGRANRAHVEARHDPVRQYAALGEAFARAERR
jgi:glycosyltransferase involved in cell wall biosynthesis